MNPFVAAILKRIIFSYLTGDRVQEGVEFVLDWLEKFLLEQAARTDTDIDDAAVKKVMGWARQYLTENPALIDGLLEKIKALL